MPNLTDISTIKSICARHNFELSKGFGQNFIVNPNICPNIVAESGIDETYGVLEIGPGFGVLTKELAMVAKKVVAVEVDHRLPPILAETLAEFDNVKIHLQDVLKIDLKEFIKTEFAGFDKIAVCANLPYYITSPIVMKLLQEKLPIESITVMVQKEAADRMSAQPGSRESGAISYAVTYFSEPELLFKVAPSSFTPPPKVTSAVMRLQVRKNAAVDIEDEKGYFEIIRAAFSQRRKTALNSISSGLHLPKDVVSKAIENAELPIKARPENLTLEDFAKLQKSLAEIT